MRKKSPEKMSPAEAAHRHEQLKRDGNFQRALHQADHPNHKEAVNTLMGVLKERD